MPKILKFRRIHLPKQEGIVIVSQPSEWANPYEVGRHGSASEVREKYSEWLKNQGSLLAKIDELRDKDLVCRNVDVHAELLMFLANATKIQRTQWWEGYELPNSSVTDGD